MKLYDYHITNKVTIFIKTKYIIESSENYTVEEITAIEKELEELANQLSEIRNKLHKLAHDKWTRQRVLTNEYR